MTLQQKPDWSEEEPKEIWVKSWVEGQEVPWWGRLVAGAAGAGGADGGRCSPGASMLTVVLD